MPKVTTPPTYSSAIAMATRRITKGVVKFTITIKKNKSVYLTMKSSVDQTVKYRQILKLSLPKPDSVSSLNKSQIIINLKIKMVNKTNINHQEVAN